MVIEIQLTQEQVALIDKTDEDLALLNWTAHFHPRYGNGGAFMAIRTTTATNGKKVFELMHRTILSRMLGRPLLRSDECDHWDTHPLNNRRDNLRLATRRQNMTNQGKRKSNTSGYKWVSWNKPAGKWEARLRMDGILKHLGLYDDPAEAYDVACKAAALHHGAFARFE